MAASLIAGWHYVRDSVGRRPLLTLLLPLFVGLAVQALLKRGAEWEDVYVRAARVLLAGGDIYAAGSAYLYPPFQALLALPFVPLPRLAARLAWYLINVACMIGAVRLAWDVTGNMRRPFDQHSRRDWLAGCLAIGCMGPYGLNALEHQQTDIVIGFLTIAGCALLLRGRMARGAAVIGLAAACKGPPLLFAAYLLFRRHWLAAAVLVLVAVGVNLAVDVIFPTATGELRLLQWLRRYVLTTQSLDTPLGMWGSALIYNQSLGGTVQRLFGATSLWTDARSLKIANYAALAVMLLVSAVAGNRARSAAEATSDDERPSRTALEFSIVTILMLLISPMSGRAHFAVLLLPALALARMAVFAGSRIAWAALVATTLIGVAAHKDLVGEQVYDWALWAGSTTLVAILLWLSCTTILLRGEAPPARPVPCP